MRGGVRIDGCDGAWTKNLRLGGSVTGFQMNAVMNAVTRWTSVFNGIVFARGWMWRWRGCTRRFKEDGCH